MIYSHVCVTSFYPKFGLPTFLGCTSSISILFVKFTFITYQINEKKTSRHVSSKLYGLKLERSPMILVPQGSFNSYNFQSRLSSGPYSSFHRILVYSTSSFIGMTWSKKFPANRNSNNLSTTIIRIEIPIIEELYLKWNVLLIPVLLGLR